METRQQWQELIDAFVVEARRYAEVSEYFELTLPRPGASEAELAEAEHRLGYRLDPGYRTLLSIVNGWDGFFFVDLLGTSDLGQGDRSADCLETVKVFADNCAGFAEMKGVGDDWSACLPVLYDDNGYSGQTCMFITDGPGRQRAGSVFCLGEEPEDLWPDLYSYLSDDLSAKRKMVEYEVRGQWSDPWDRNIRTDPPTLPSILDKIDEQLRATGQPLMRCHPGATETALQAANQHLPHALHPEHHALLQISDGLDLPGFGHILSTTELADSRRWQELLELAVLHQQDALDHHKKSGVMLPDEIYREPVAARIGRIPAVPFAYSIIECEVFGYQGVSYNLYGVDVRDGKIRHLIQDAAPTPPNAYRPDYACTVQNHLLRFCEKLWTTSQNTQFRGRKTR
ncbi:SMI1/KNR4 family protein [Mycobacteroides abscessus]